jgi:signal transduction histidine kinase
MDVLLLILCFVAILLFIVNLYFERRNHKRIEEINKRMNAMIINMVETFKHWVNLKNNINEFYNTLNKKDDNQKNKKDDTT